MVIVQEAAGANIEAVQSDAVHRAAPVPARLLAPSTSGSGPVFVTVSNWSDDAAPGSATGDPLLTAAALLARAGRSQEKRAGWKRR